MDKADEILRQKLETLYDRYNQRHFVDPDPLLYLYGYPETRDREVAGLIASCLAYGRVKMIMKTVGAVLEALGPSPYTYLARARSGEIQKQFMGFKYRFATDAHLSCLMMGIQGIIREFGSLEACFVQGKADAGIQEGLGRLYNEIARAGDVGHLLADPGKTSACKRSHLFLRWMVRKDDVDPGGWTIVSPAHLVYPVDTHMYKIGRLLGFTRRKSPDRSCALEITRGFRKLCSRDPVRYDFSLTRFGIRQQFDMTDLEAFIHLTPQDIGPKVRLLK